MAIQTQGILDILAGYGIRPGDHPDWEMDHPEVGTIEEGETVYATSVAEVFRDRDDELLTPDHPRVWDWWKQVEQIIEASRRGGLAPGQPPSGKRAGPEPLCAWYCPIHFFGHGWGIYIRESCILSEALAIARSVDWGRVHLSKSQIAQHLLRSAFYVFFLHEQFHHKVESLGFRLLISTATDRYQPYKRNVYRRNFLTPDCLEESLANAESYRRFGETRYVQRLDPAIREGLRQHLKASFAMQPPGYREGLGYLSDADYRGGLYGLQSQMLDGLNPPHTPVDRWAVAPNMITALADITEDIWMILPARSWSIFKPTSVDPGATASSRAMETALTKHYGYAREPGGKGSHVKLKKAGAPTIILPMDRVVSPGVVKQVLNILGGYPMSRLPDLLGGKLDPSV